MDDFWRGVLKGSVGPRDNDSRFLLDVHTRDLPGEATMRRYGDGDEVDLVVVGAGAGGSVLAQRLARAGWRVVIIEAGPFWHPDEDWVSDEAGSHSLYWTQNRIIGGADPIELGKNNSGRGVGGSMVHYAGYTPRFHPSDFSTRTDDGVGADWPIGYHDLRPHYEQVERELPVSGQDWPWGYPHRYPFSPHPVSGAASKLHEGARRLGIEMRVGPVGIVNGTFGNRPHCIYRGYCLQGCKVNAKASPFVTHLPDALAHDVEIRADAMALRVELDDATGRARGVVYVRDGDGGASPAARPVRRPRLLLHRDPADAAQLDEPPLPARAVQHRGPGRALRHGAGREPDRGAMAGGAASVQGAAPGDLQRAVLRDRHHPRLRPRVLHPDRVPLPIGWAEHVLANGHWGRALREYMRDYNHWATVGVLNELLAHPDNRITLADQTDPYGLPVARLDYSLCANDKANMAWSTKVITDIVRAAGAQEVLTIQRFAHLIGGARMGSSQETSVVDASQRSWAVPNLFLADGSVCPTQGSANPALTIMALASRLAERMASGKAMSSDPSDRSGRHLMQENPS